MSYLFSRCTKPREKPDEIDKISESIAAQDEAIELAENMFNKLTQQMNECLKDAKEQMKRGNKDAAKIKFAQKYQFACTIKEVAQQIQDAQVRKLKLTLLSVKAMSKQSTEDYVNTIKFVAKEHNINDMSKLTNEVTDTQEQLKEWQEGMDKISMVTQYKSSVDEDDLEEEFSKLEEEVANEQDGVSESMNSQNKKKNKNKNTPTQNGENIKPTSVPGGIKPAKTKITLNKKIQRITNPTEEQQQLLSDIK